MKRFKDWFKSGMEINYGIAVLNRKQNEDGTHSVVHFCGFEEPPTPECFENLKKELAEDKEFGLTKERELFFVEATPEMVKYFKSVVVDKEKG